MLLKLLPQFHSSQQLKQIIIGSAALGLFSISSLVALVSCVPLINQLRAGEDRNLRFALRTRELAVAEFINRAKDVGQQITSRTRARQMLEDYVKGGGNREALASFSQEILTEAIGRSQDVAGVARFTPRGEFIAQAGLSIPADLWVFPPEGTHAALVNGPYEIEGAAYLIVSTPMLNPQKEHVGTDILAFKISSLRNLTEDYTGLGETGEMVLGQIRDQELNLLFPLREGAQPSTILIDSLRQAIATHDHTALNDVKTVSDSEIIVFGTVAETGWGIAVRMSRQELYAPVNRQLWITGGAILVLSSLGTGGILLLLKPILRRVADVEDLQAQVQEKEDALRQLKKAQSRLVQAEKMSGLGQMVAGIAHEINNPISFIHSNLTVAQQYGIDLLELVRLYQRDCLNPSDEILATAEDIDLDFLQEDYPRIFKSMHNGTSRIRDIVKSLRTFSRLDEAELKTVDIHAGIDSVLMLLQNRCTAQGNWPAIEIVKNYGDLPAVECYPNQLNQACFNVISNAVDALRAPTRQVALAGVGAPEAKLASKPPGRIEIKTERVGQSAIAIHISDNGPGIETALQSKIFDPFFTTKPVGEGTGMGLAMSYNIICDVHGGDLFCYSEPGSGCTFTLQIPIQPKVRTS